MKLNLYYDDKYHCTGYNNISINDAEDLFFLDTYVDDGEATEIVVNDVLSHITLKNFDNSLTKLINKLHIGGKIIFIGTDCKLLAKAYTFNDITLQDFADALFGDENKSTIDLLTLSEMLVVNHDLHIIKQSVDDFQYYIEAIRNVTNTNIM